MELKSFVSEVYNSIDQADAVKFASFITPAGLFRFANTPAVVGNREIEEYVDGFFKSLKGISHSSLESWEAQDTIFVNGNVRYIRHNGTALEAPFSCTWKMKDQLINEYLIFIDASELYK